jgi:hypothetical protein
MMAQLESAAKVSRVRLFVSTLLTILLHDRPRYSSHKFTGGGATLRIFSARLNAEMFSIQIHLIESLSRRDADDQLAEIAPMQEPDKRFGRVFKPIDDIFAVLDPTLAQPLGNIS